MRRPGAAAARSLLFAILALAGAVAPGIAGSGPALSGPARPHALGGGVKPDWRGADLANTGQLTATGPSGGPLTRVFTGTLDTSGSNPAQGIELSPGGNVVVVGAFAVAEFTPTTPGSTLWTYTDASGFGLADATGAPSNPVLSADGNWYLGDDAGNLVAISDTTGAGARISVDPNIPLQDTPKIAPDGTLWLAGNGDGAVFHIHPDGSGVGGNPANVYAAGNTMLPVGYPCNVNGTRPVSSRAPYHAYGEGALDSGGYFYVASVERVSGCSTPVGAVYKINAAGTSQWSLNGGGSTPIPKPR